MSAQSRIQRFEQFLSMIIRGLGESVLYLSALMVIVTALVVLLVDGLGIGSLMLQDSLTYLHATLIMLGSAYALQKDEHVRVDVFYRQFSEIQKAWVNALGTLVFLMPFCVLLMVLSWDFVCNAWRINEGSLDAGGIPAVFLLKTLLLLMPITLFIQALAHLLRDACALMNHEARNND